MRYAAILALFVLAGSAANSQTLPQTGATHDTDCVDHSYKRSRLLREAALMTPWLANTKTRLEAVLEKELLPEKFENDAQCVFLIDASGVVQKEDVPTKAGTRFGEEYILSLLAKASPLAHLPGGVSTPQKIKIALRQAQILIWLVQN
jgi:hypothetical protein